MSNRLGLFRLVLLPGGHEVMFSNPVGLAEKIILAKATSSEISN
jgi:hypothetical protein